MEKTEFDALVAKIEESTGAKVTEQVEEALKGYDAEALKNLASKEDLKGLVKQEDIQSLKTKLDEVADKANLAQENMNTNVLKSFEQQLTEQLEAQKDAIASIKGNAKKEVILTLKVVGTQTTGNITLPSATPTSYTYQNNPNLYLKPEAIPFVQNFTDNAPTNMVSLAYVDEVSGEGDAEFIGEGVIKPLIDIDYEIRYSQAKKVAGKIKVSEEALTDIPFMNAEISRKLRQRHDLVLQDGILNGDGTGANLLGITNVAAGFASGGLATSIESAQYYDVLVAAYNQILVTSDSNYIPNAVFVHPTDATKMKLTKDAQNNYIIPPFVSSTGDVINNMRIVQNTKIPLGFFLMGDFSKSHVRNYVDFSIRIFYSGEDFERNQITILGESRVHHYISENEKIAFVYDQFSVAATALETV